MPPSDSLRRTPLLELRQISKRFSRPLDLAARLAQKLGAAISSETVHAVDQLSLTIGRGEVVGLVGESGCGKSTLGRLALGMYPPSGGQRYWFGSDRAAASGDTLPIDDLPAAEKKAIQLKMQMVFQDPYASLNPRMRVGQAISEAPLVHGLLKPQDRDAWLAQSLQKVGLDPSLAERYPHQFSGGQRARIGIARALAVAPEFLVCDEAVSALDVSIQAQIINLFMQLRADLELTYLFISHDLGVIRYVSDRVVVMYLGRMVESASSDEIFERPHHPYTQALIAELPRIAGHKRHYQSIQGEIPSPLHPPGGCHFHPRCPRATAQCKTLAPPLRQVAAGHWSACILDAGDADRG
jgi:peptide/nickel transport system ATP-binding protein